jgi:hypothetical protein
MKIVAHPLVVAVALGLLDPGVLSQDGQDPQEPLERTSDGALQEGTDGPSPEQFAQIELEWQSVRDLV